MAPIFGDVLGLGAARVAAAVAARLAAGGGRGVVVALDERIGRALFRLGLEVVVALPAPRRRRGKGPQVVAAAPRALPFAEGALAAVVGGAALSPTAPAGASALVEAARVVRAGGLVVTATPLGGLLRSPPAPDALTGAFLHAALVEVEQERTGSSLLTLARVPAFRA